jgi:hypothetical protein
MPDLEAVLMKDGIHYELYVGDDLLWIDLSFTDVVAIFESEGV